MNIRPKVFHQSIYRNNLNQDNFIEPLTLITKGEASQEAQVIK